MGAKKRHTHKKFHEMVFLAGKVYIPCVCLLDSVIQVLAILASRNTPNIWKARIKTGYFFAAVWRLEKRKKKKINEKNWVCCSARLGLWFLTECPKRTVALAFHSRWNALSALAHRTVEIATSAFGMSTMSTVYDTQFSSLLAFNRGKWVKPYTIFPSFRMLIMKLMAVIWAFFCSHTVTIATHTHTAMIHLM